MKKKLSSFLQITALAKNEWRPAALHASGGRLRRWSVSRLPQQRSGQMSDSETTTNHKVIKEWAEEREGRPATVRATEEDGHAGILRIDFGPPEDRLEEIEWDEFFRKFDESDLAFLYQDRTKDGKLSRFHKFVRRSAA